MQITANQIDPEKQLCPLCQSLLEMDLAKVENCPMVWHIKIQNDGSSIL